VKRLVLLRHGESVWNAEGRIQGQLCKGLSDTGRRQAEATAIALSGQYPRAALVTSDLPRCVETSAPLAAALGVEAEVDRRLRERSFGDWEGRRRSEVAEADGERWQRWLVGDEVVGDVGGETGEQLADRIEPVWRQLMTGTPDGEVTIAVTHGGPVWYGVHRLLGLTPPVLGGVGNASVTELIGWVDGDTGALTMVLLDGWNETSHLPLELRNGWLPPGDERPRIR